MPEIAVLHAGRRQGRRLANEGAFRAAIEDGKQVITFLNGVWFDVTVNDGGEIVYTARPEKKPEGMDPEAADKAMVREFTRR